ncbi:hypothetical protein [Yersinia pseudotuberculosis]|uniref:hypothetical protein n=1 Tax=Yersinia pseudotuberculosis TaxID=633 RepID=UPI001A9CC1C2|nr:hypothetical protein [Yersinia pseudotuberculosis]MBO1548978.1 hypothetical protein [Yersinia pseudotuberculosis]MBO1569131.1 hypothetical protein [Yersinia pseudotuberculosis]MBO1584101.1 hypothetical protein [Yersinia pseudotuberculosis]MBO1633181.1 hypothetical protein [Yersinia pseudotuberculosis]
MKNDIYTDSKKLAVILEKKGLHFYYESIVDAIEYSSTANEILMKLRFILKEIYIDNSKLNKIDKDLIKEILNKINDSL